MRNIFICILFIILILLVFYDLLKIKNIEGSKACCEASASFRPIVDWWDGKQYASTCQGETTCDMAKYDTLKGVKSGGNVNWSDKCGNKKGRNAYYKKRNFMCRERCTFCWGGDRDRRHDGGCHSACRGSAGAQKDCVYSNTTACPCDTARTTTNATLDWDKYIEHGSRKIYNPCAGDGQTERYGTKTFANHLSNTLYSNGTKTSSFSINPSSLMCRRCWNPGDSSKMSHVNNKIKYKYDTLNKNGWRYNNYGTDAEQHTCIMPSGKYDSGTKYVGINTKNILIKEIDARPLNNICKDCADGWGGRDCGIQTKFNNDILNVNVSPGANELKDTITGIMINMLIWTYYRKNGDARIDHIGSCKTTDCPPTNAFNAFVNKVNDFVEKKLTAFKTNVLTKLNTFTDKTLKINDNEAFFLGVKEINNTNHKNPTGVDDGFYNNIMTDGQISTQEAKNWLIKNTWKRIKDVTSWTNNEIDSAKTISYYGNNTTSDYEKIYTHFLKCLIIDEFCDVGTTGDQLVIVEDDPKKTFSIDFNNGNNDWGLDTLDPEPQMRVPRTSTVAVLKRLPTKIYEYAIVNLKYKDDSNDHYKFLEKKIWLYKLASEFNNFKATRESQNNWDNWDDDIQELIQLIINAENNIYTNFKVAPTKFSLKHSVPYEDVKDSWVYQEIYEYILIWLYLKLKAENFVNENIMSEVSDKHPNSINKTDYSGLLQIITTGGDNEIETSIISDIKQISFGFLDLYGIVKGGEADATNDRVRWEIAESLQFTDFIGKEMFTNIKEGFRYNTTDNTTVWENIKKNLEEVMIERKTDLHTKMTDIVLINQDVKNEPLDFQVFIRNKVADRVEILLKNWRNWSDVDLTNMGDIYKKIVELWSSIPDATTNTAQCSNLCEKNVAENGRSYSSVYGSPAVGTGLARSTLDSDQSWSAQTNDVNQWIQIDMGVPTHVGGVITRGRHDWDQWVTRYTVTTSIDGTTWTDVDGGKEFTGNTDRNTKVRQSFTKPVKARYVRFNPRSWQSHISMRADVLLCRSMDCTLDNITDWFINKKTEFKNSFLKGKPGEPTLSTNYDCIGKCCDQREEQDLAQQKQCYRKNGEKIYKLSGVSDNDNCINTNDWDKYGIKLTPINDYCYKGGTEAAIECGNDANCIAYGTDGSGCFVNGAWVGEHKTKDECETKDEDSDPLPSWSSCWKILEDDADGAGWPPQGNSSATAYTVWESPQVNCGKTDHVCKEICENIYENSKGKFLKKKSNLKAQIFDERRKEQISEMIEGEGSGLPIDDKTALKQKIFERDYQKERCVYDSNKGLWYANMGPFSLHHNDTDSTKFYGMGVNVLWESGEGWGRLNKTSINKKLKDETDGKTLQLTKAEIVPSGGKYHVASSAISEDVTKAKFKISSGNLVLKDPGTGYLVNETLTLNAAEITGVDEDIIITLTEKDIIKGERRGHQMKNVGGKNEISEVELSGGEYLKNISATDDESYKRQMSTLRWKDIQGEIQTCWGSDDPSAVPSDAQSIEANVLDADETYKLIIQREGQTPQDISKCIRDVDQRACNNKFKKARINYWNDYTNNNSARALRSTESGSEAVAQARATASDVTPAERGVAGEEGQTTTIESVYNENAFKESGLLDNNYNKEESMELKEEEEEKTPSLFEKIIPFTWF